MREHCPITFGIMVLNDTLYSHLAEVEEAAELRLDRLVPQLARQAGCTEALKASDPMKRMQRMNACKSQAEEIILQELIFAS